MIPIKRIFLFLYIAVCITAIPARATVPETLSERDRKEIIDLLAACADIPYYDSAIADTDELTRRVLYTYRNFEWITDVPPNAAEGHNSLMLCSGAYIESAMHTAFRIAPPRPAPSEITERRFCYSSGMYYWTGGYTRFYATDVHDIISVRRVSDNSIEIVFSDTYTEAGKKPQKERSTAVLAHDAEGWYVTSLSMGGIGAPTPDPEQEQPAPDPVTPFMRRYLPWLVALLTLAAAGLVLYVFILKKHY